MRFFQKLQKHAAHLLIAGVAVVFIFAYMTLLYAIPDKIYIRDSNEKISLSLPVSFYKVKTDTTAEEAVRSMESYAGGSAEDVLVDSAEVTYQCRLFGVIPLKEVSAQVTDEQSLIAGGTSVGIYVKTDGILVIGTGQVTNRQGETVSPSENLIKSGDYIQEINGTPITDKEQLIESVEQSGGNQMVFKIQRDHAFLEVAVTPVESIEGNYKIGLWVRDDLAGIGTLTYVTADNQFGALGHAVSDADTGVVLNMSEGLLYKSSIVGIIKGESGTPGELTGVIDYSQSNCLGNIEKNTQAGIYGTLSQLPDGLSGQTLPIGYKQEIQTAAAQILCAIDGEVKSYDIRITEVDFHEDEEYKEIMFEVTDKDLLETTGGIVQGMFWSYNSINTGNPHK